MRIINTATLWLQVWDSFDQQRESHCQCFARIVGLLDYLKKLLMQ